VWVAVCRYRGSKRVLPSYRGGPLQTNMMLCDAPAMNLSLITAEMATGKQSTEQHDMFAHMGGGPWKPEAVRRGLSYTALVAPLPYPSLRHPPSRVWMEEAECLLLGAGE
jgi:hypothetical protein